MLKIFNQHTLHSVEDELNFAIGMVEALTNNSTVAFVVCDLNHLVCYVNATFVQLFGWTETEAVGMANPIVPPRSGPALPICSGSMNSTCPKPRR